MLIVTSCCLLLMVALGLIFHWRGETVRLPEWQGASDGRPSVGRVILGCLQLLGVGMISGLLAGLLVVGPGGRLAMRVLAATSPDAQGFVTEASEVVGEITLDGTIGFFIFVGLPFGALSGLLYMVVHRALPRGLTGGALFGALLLITLGTRVDPLRSENPDFDIVRPGWLAIALFAILALTTGAFVAAAAGRLSRVFAGGAETAPVVTPPSRARRSRGILVMQGVVGLLVLASLPAFIGAMLGIA